MDQIVPNNDRSRPRVLVVEDEWLLMMDLEQALEEAGYAVEAFTDGAAALAAATAEPVRFAAAVVNLGLGAGRPAGQAVVRALRALHPGLPVVVTTGYALGAPQADLRGLGGPTGRLAKPIAHTELLARLAEVTARPADPRGPDRRRRS
jgi:DNA-binding response OmpR family regulator